MLEGNQPDAFYALATYETPTTQLTEFDPIVLYT